MMVLASSLRNRICTPPSEEQLAGVGAVYPGMASGGPTAWAWEVGDLVGMALHA